ncbi:hypothetical protein [Chryseobacterium indoltheticum]|jgi:hypothetical protein|uniref:hypothetical protein n=1 Tax=Chryseobacterium indoltheticum TaxID=254 RepID=UPI00242F4D86|nr:hypothetical protein [Chryseobacterium indoltheticum]MDF2831868.1 hypothetical protein [Chryseobacterium indoltheticum]
MRNLKKLKRSDLGKILGAGHGEPIPVNDCGGQSYGIPSSGSCPAGYIYCSLPSCCFKSNRPYACIDY